MWLLVVLLVFALLFLPGLYALTAAKTPRPAPPLRPWRLAVSGVVAAAGGLLLVALSQDWWIFHNQDDEPPRTADAADQFPLLILLVAVVCAGLTLASVWGRRSWALLGLPFAWVLVGLARIWVYGGLDLQHNHGEILGGLTLATWALLLLSVASAAGTFIRLAERRAAAPAGPYATVPPPPPSF